MIRPILVFIAIAFGVGYAVKGPFQALLFYTWIAYFRPDFWIGYLDFIWELRLSYHVALFLIASTLLTGQRFRFGFGPLLMALFAVHSLISTLVSPAPDWAWFMWNSSIPSVVTAYLIVVLVTDEKRLRQVLLVMAVSVAFEASKQGWLQFILNPGGQNFNEHPSFGDNNGVAVGMLMVFPVLLGLARTAAGPWERHFHRFLALGMFYRALMTYSRGGFLACGAIGFHYFMRSRRKVVAIIAMVVVTALIVPVLPPAFWGRMETIQVSRDQLEDEETDASIRGRLHFWKVAMVMANDRPLTGVGHSAFNHMYNSYDPSDGAFGRGRSVHSTWLGLLAELGYPGFIIFTVLLAFAFKACRRARLLAKRRPELETLGACAIAIEAGLLAFAVGGTFVIFQYTEIVWHYLGFAIVLDRIAKQYEEASVPAATTTSFGLSVQGRTIPSAAALSPTSRRAVHS